MWAVTRLKQTWEALPQRSHAVVEELNTLMENKKNYGKEANFRIKKCPNMIIKSAL